MNIFRRKRFVSIHECLLMNGIFIKFHFKGEHGVCQLTVLSRQYILLQKTRASQKIYSCMMLYLLILQHREIIKFPFPNSSQFIYRIRIWVKLIKFLKWKENTWTMNCWKNRSFVATILSDKVAWFSFISGHACWDHNLLLSKAFYLQPHLLIAIIYLVCAFVREKLLLFLYIPMSFSFVYCLSV